jgi:hypothetical protein
MDNGASGRPLRIGLPPLLSDASGLNIYDNYFRDMTLGDRNFAENR